MLVEFKYDPNTVITFPKGIIGYPKLKKFVLLESEKNEDNIMYEMQSLDDPEFALPVIDPLPFVNDYHPNIQAAELSEIGTINDDNFLVLTTVTLGSTLKETSINLQAPIVINLQTLNAAQVIVDNTDTYPVKNFIFDK